MGATFGIGVGGFKEAQPAVMIRMNSSPQLVVCFVVSLTYPETAFSARKNLITKRKAQSSSLTLDRLLNAIGLNPAA